MYIYICDKKDLLPKTYIQKRPTVTKETYCTHKQTYFWDKRDLQVCKRGRVPRALCETVKEKKKKKKTCGCAR